MVAHWLHPVPFFRHGKTVVKDTYFVNATGLPSPEHFSTAYDLDAEVEVSGGRVPVEPVALVHVLVR